MVKRKFSAWAKIICATFASVLFLCSCTPTAEFPYLPAESDAEGISEIILRVADNASPTVVEKARCLKNDLEAQTGIPAYLVYESEQIILRDGGVEILVGALSNEISKRAIGDMRSKDHTCRADGNVLVIGGKSDAATCDAIDRYSREILPAATALSIIPPMGGFDFVGEYTVKSASVNGLSLGDYSIALKNDMDTDILNIAYDLRDEISEKLGYWLDVRSEDNGEILGNCIRILADADIPRGAAYIEPYEGGILMTSASAVGLSKCAERLVELLEVGGGNAEISEKMAVAYGSVSIDVAFMEFDSTSPFGSALGVGTMVEPLMRNRPTAVFFNGIDTQKGLILQENLSRYSSVTVGETYYGFSLADCEVIGVSTEESHTVECYRIKYGECSFILVRIGCNEGTVGEVDISELVTDTELPVLAVVHGESASTVTKIVSDRGMSRVCGSEDIICYADSGNIYANITAVENAANYRQIRITVDH